jgi:hypothetical protein
MNTPNMTHSAILPNFHRFPLSRRSMRKNRASCRRRSPNMQRAAAKKYPLADNNAAKRAMRYFREEEQRSTECGFYLGEMSGT